MAGAGLELLAESGGVLDEVDEVAWSAAVDDELIAASEAAPELLGSRR